MQFREFTTNTDLSVAATNFPEVSKRSSDAVWGLVEHDRSVFGRDIGEAIGSFLAAPWQKALHDETFGGETACNKCTDGGAGSGNGADVGAGIDCGVHEAFAWV